MRASSSACSTVLGVSAALPDLRISRAMIDCINSDLVIFDLVNHLIRKSLSQCTPLLSMNFRILFWGFLDGGNTFVDLLQEIVTEFSVALVVPLDSLLRVEIGVGREPCFHFFLFRRRS